MKIWNKKDEEYLLENYQKMEVSDISKNLGRSNISIHHKANRLKLKKYKWKKEQIDFLIKNYDNFSDEELGNMLGLKKNSIMVKRMSLGLKKDLSYLYKKQYKEGKRKVVINIPNNFISEWRKKNMTGKNYEQLYGKEKSDEIKKKLSDRMKIHNPSFGGLSDTHKKNIGLASKKQWKNESYRKKMFEAFLGDLNPSKRPEVRKKHKESAIKQWKNKKSRDKLLDGLKWRPNKPETTMINIIKKNNLPFNYVGDGKIWFRNNFGAFNPDFLSKNPKHIIEIFGDYWHNLPKNKIRDKYRLKAYSKYGYKTLIIWENELQDEKKVVEKIKLFVGGIKCHVGRNSKSV